MVNRQYYRFLWIKIMYVQQYCYSAMHDYLHTSIKNLSSFCMIIVDLKNFYMMFKTKC